MNAATKSRWANVITALVSIIAVGQTVVMSPPFTPHTVYVFGIVATYLSLTLTKWKQYLSPDVSKVGENITIWIAIGATIMGILDLINVFSFSAEVNMWIRWSITVSMTVINIISKQLFPSQLQKEKMQELKFK